MASRALCIGINYVGTGAELGGCCNDACDWAAHLKARGFPVTLLLEQAAASAALEHEIGRLCAELGPGEVGFISFSGHGTWLPDASGDESDGRDEALVAYDYGANGQGLLVDDRLQQLFAQRHRDSRLVLVTDCCHSGTMFRFVAPGTAATRVRYLPPAPLCTDPRLLRAVQRLGPAGPHAPERPVPGLVHFAACRDHEYSYDAVIAGKPCGAFTSAAMSILDADRPAGSPFSYASFQRGIGELLPQPAYPQSPRLNATAADAARPWLT